MVDHKGEIIAGEPGEGMRLTPSTTPDGARAEENSWGDLLEEGVRAGGGIRRRQCRDDFDHREESGRGRRPVQLAHRVQVGQAFRGSSRV